MSKPQVIQLMAPSRNKDKFSRMKALLRFEGVAVDLSLRIKLEMTRFPRNSSDGTVDSPQKLVREFVFYVDPLDLGGSALLACAGRKNDVAIFNRGNELKKVNRTTAKNKRIRVQEEGNDVTTQRKSETVWETDDDTLWEIQTFQTQRTRRTITAFVRDTCLIAENILSYSKENEGKIGELFLNQLQNLVATAEKITNLRESAMFELKLIPIDLDGQKSESIKFQLDEIGVLNLIFFCGEIANANYAGGVVFFGGLKVVKRKGKVHIATGSAFAKMTEEQVVGFKVAISEFLEMGHLPKHDLRGGITITSPPIVTKSKELVDGGQLLVNIRDRKAFLSYFDAAKLYTYL